MSKQKKQLLAALKDYITEHQRSIDSFDEDDFRSIGAVYGDTRDWEEIRHDALNLRKAGKVGSLLGGKGPSKLDDLTCPHCGERYGG